MTAAQVTKAIFFAVACCPTPWRLCRRCDRVWHVAQPGHVYAELPPECDGVVKEEECVECAERGRE